LIFPFAGTIPEGSHAPGHYDLEQAGYMPTLVLKKTPLGEWSEAPGDA